MMTVESGEHTIGRDSAIQAGLGPEVANRRLVRRLQRQVEAAMKGGRLTDLCENNAGISRVIELLDGAKVIWLGSSTVDGRDVCVDRRGGLYMVSSFIAGGLQHGDRMPPSPHSKTTRKFDNIDWARDGQRALAFIKKLAEKAKQTTSS